MATLPMIYCDTPPHVLVSDDRCVLTTTLFIDAIEPERVRSIPLHTLRRLTVSTHVVQGHQLVLLGLQFDHGVELVAVPDGVDVFGLVARVAAAAGINLASRGADARAES